MAKQMVVKSSLMQASKSFYSLSKKTSKMLSFCNYFITLPTQKENNMKQTLTSYFRLSLLLSLRTLGTRE